MGRRTRGSCRRLRHRLGDARGSLARLFCAEELAEQLRKAFEESFDVYGQHIKMTASIGIAQYPDDGSDFDTLLLAVRLLRPVHHQI